MKLKLSGAVRRKPHIVAINNIYRYYSDNRNYIVTEIHNMSSSLSTRCSQYYSVMKLSTYLILKLVPYIMKCIVLYLPFLIFFAVNENILVTVIAISVSILIDIFLISYINITYTGIINKNSVLIPDKEFDRFIVIDDEVESPETTKVFIYKGRCII